MRRANGGARFATDKYHLSSFRITTRYIRDNNQGQNSGKLGKKVFPRTAAVSATFENVKQFYEQAFSIGAVKGLCVGIFHEGQESCIFTSLHVVAEIQ